MWDEEKRGTRKDKTMTTEDQQLEDARRFGIVMLSLLLGFAALFVVAGSIVSMLMH
jgi:hypothetical protein